jgi:DNA polymerase II small subunit
MIICPGNHDAMRIAEPQMELYKDFAKPIWELDNAIMVTNPCLVNIHATEGFSGFDVLLYHGYSFDYFAANVDSIRNGGGYDRADLIMKFLLQRRHLAPAHTSTLYIPSPKEDYLVIKKVPDFFVTGHIHKSSVANYKGVTMICGSCWQSKTSFQEKVGHHPEPCRVPIANLKTRDVKILKFG